VQGERERWYGLLVGDLTVSVHGAREKLIRWSAFPMTRRLATQIDQNVADAYACRLVPTMRARMQMGIAFLLDGH
jgi:hypothetical protein